MMVDLYRGFAEPLTHGTLFAWHKMVMSGYRRVETIGDYRRHDESHADRLRRDRPGEGPLRGAAFIPHRRRKWTASSRGSTTARPAASIHCPPLTRAGIAHLYFESIHPFEDGNGRIGRALAEKSLAQNLGQPTLIALAFTIERRRKAYYAMLEESNRDLAITPWLTWFGETVLAAQRVTLERIEFHIAKARFYDRLRGQLNARQEKVIARMFREGIDGFKGGLSAENHISITGASRATATRDLQDLRRQGRTDPDRRAPAHAVSPETRIESRTATDPATLHQPAKTLIAGDARHCSLR